MVSIKNSFGPDRRKMCLQEHSNTTVVVCSLQNYAKPVASTQYAAYRLFNNFTDSCICTETDDSDPLKIPLHSRICTDFTPD